MRTATKIVLGSRASQINKDVARKVDEEISVTVVRMPFDAYSTSFKEVRP